MPSFTPPQFPQGLPASPRANRQMLPPLQTTFPTPTPISVQSASSSASTLVTAQPPPHSPSSLIFINATIPLSPASSISSVASPYKWDSYQGLEPRKRSGFAKLFSCFGREERARRQRDRGINDFEKVGGGGHWSEY